MSRASGLQPRMTKGRVICLSETEICALTSLSTYGSTPFPPCELLTARTGKQNTSLQLGTKTSASEDGVPVRAADVLGPQRYLSFPRI